MDKPYQTIITINPQIRGGKPTIRGLRYTVYDILSYLAAGMSTAEISVLDKDGTVLFSHYGASLTDVPADCGAAQSLLEDLDVAKPVDVDDADVTIYADPGAAPDIPGLTPHVHEYAQPNLGETGVFSVFDDAYKDEE